MRLVEQSQVKTQEQAYLDLSSMACIAGLRIPGLSFIANDSIYLGLLHLNPPSSSCCIVIIGRRLGLRRLVQVWVFQFEIHDGEFSVTLETRLYSGVSW